MQTRSMPLTKLTLTNLPSVSSKSDLMAAANDPESSEVLSPRSTTSSKMAADPSTSGKWQADDDVNTCSACQASFGLFNRKHHCRVCGLIFCHDCSNFFAAVPSMGFRHPVRVCGGCFMHRQSAKKSRSATKHRGGVDESTGVATSPAPELTMVRTPRLLSQAAAQPETPTITRKLFEEVLSPTVAAAAHTSLPQTRSPLRALNSSTLNDSTMTTAATGISKLNVSPSVGKGAELLATMPSAGPGGKLGVPSPPPCLGSPGSAPAVAPPPQRAQARAPLPCGKGGIMELVPSTLEVPTLSFLTSSTPAAVPALACHHHNHNAQLRSVLPHSTTPTVVMIPAMEIPPSLKQSEQEGRQLITQAQIEEFCKVKESFVNELIASLYHQRPTKIPSQKKEQQQKKKRSLLNPLRWVSIATSVACLPMTLPHSMACALLSTSERLRASYFPTQLPYSIPTTPAGVAWAAAKVVTHPPRMAAKAALKLPVASVVLLRGMGMAMVKPSTTKSQSQNQNRLTL